MHVPKYTIVGLYFKVGSRKVIQAGAFVMLFFGVLNKFGALFVTIPDPIIGGVFIVMFGKHLS